MVTNENENNSPKSLGHKGNSFNKDIYGNTGLSQETRRISNNLTLHPEELEKTKQNPSQQRGGNNKDQNVNKLNRDKKIKKIMKTKRWSFENKIDKPSAK